ncbi:sensor histidine kinase [Treponema primitia]|uniref:sensor histidine kinase n=1 Tax=Treponema primitia TaxID=88058 RepID=UPI00397EC869
MEKRFWQMCFLGAFILSGSFSAFCAGNSVASSSGQGDHSGEPVYMFSRQWLDIERLMLEEKGQDQNEQLLEMLRGFRVSLEDLIETPLYQTYRFNSLFHTEIMNRVFTASANFEEAVLRGQQEKLPALALDMSEALNNWQKQDAEVADAIHLRYFNQFFILTAVISLLALAIWLLNRALAHSQVRAEQSAAFSQAIVLAQEDERSRISRELHDTVAQELRAQALRIAGLKRVEDRTEQAALCDELAATQRGLVESIRAICDGLFPPDFRYQGLNDALDRLCRDFGERTGIDCRLTLREDPRYTGMDTTAQLQCFRLVQEALANIEKHAEASEAAVLLRWEEDALLICISDDGKGFAVPPSREKPAIYASGHFGIRGMYTRTAILGGSLRFESESGEGTTVIIRAPFPREAPKP